jgi:superfamily II DNA or RNA helicase
MGLKLWRGNSYTEVGGDAAFMQRITRELAVPIKYTAEERKQSRFGSYFEEQGQWYGSLVQPSGRIPAGLTRHVHRLAKHFNVPCDYRDSRVIPEDHYPWYSLTMKERPYQEVAHKQFLQGGCGVIHAPPRSGKTLMAMRAIDALAQPCVYLAPSVAIVRQTYEAMIKVFGEEMVARLDGHALPHQKDISKPIVIATAQSAVKQSSEWWKTRHFLIIDEFHHAAAETYHKVNAKAEHVYYRLCLTGTHYRTGGDALAMEAICSNLLYEIPVDYLVKAGYLAAPFVQFTRLLGSSRPATTDWTDLYKRGIAEDEKRNAWVIRLATSLYEQGIPTIVLTRRRAHADMLAENIPYAVAVKGGEAALTDSTIDQFRSGSIQTLVGTTVIGEGVDLPNAGAVVFASGGGPGVQQMQSYFRSMTAYPGKHWGLVYDVLDLHQAILTVHATKRLEFARENLGAANVQVCS